MVRVEQMLIDTTTDFGKRVEERLRNDELLWLTTVSPDGTPQPSLIWFYWDGETVLIYSQPNAPKIRNIAANPRVSLNFQANDEGEDVVILIGEAAVDPTAPPSNLHEAYRHKYVQATQHINYTPESLAAEFSAAIRVTPTRVRGF
jgi:PPOX class probable F420-dependent enzyme